MLHPVAESPAHEAAEETATNEMSAGVAHGQLQTDRCPQCGADRMTAEIGAPPDKETQDLER